MSNSTSEAGILLFEENTSFRVGKRERGQLLCHLDPAFNVALLVTVSFVHVNELIFTHNGIN